MSITIKIYFCLVIVSRAQFTDSTGIDSWSISVRIKDFVPKSHFPVSWGVPPENPEKGFYGAKSNSALKSHIFPVSTQGKVTFWSRMGKSPWIYSWNFVFHRPGDMRSADLIPSTRTMCNNVVIYPRPSPRGGPGAYYAIISVRLCLSFV